MNTAVAKISIHRNTAFVSLNDRGIRLIRIVAAIHKE